MNIPFYSAYCERQHLYALYRRLDEAAREGDTERVRALLDRGAKPNGLSPHRRGICHMREPLAPAIRSGNIETVRLLLDQGADPNHSSSPWFCPLNWAIGAASLEMIRLVIERGADVNLPRMSYKPLMIAAAHGFIEFVLCLLQCGADLHARDESGMTALTYAATSGSEDVVYLLRERGAVVTVLDAIALHGTSMYEQLRASADREIARNPSRWGGVLMEEAVDQNNVTQVRLLLDAGVNPMVNQNMALTQATIHNREEIVRFLLERGADPNLRIWSKERAMKFARKKRNRVIIDLLKQYGARW